MREDDCLANDATITARCVQGLRKGSAAEAAAAATLLGLHIVTVALGDSSSYAEAQPELLKAAAQGKTPAVRVAATDALAVATFAAADDEGDTLEVMRALAALWRQESDKAKAAAVAGWSLLFTTLRRGLSSGLVEQSLEALGQLLHAPDVAVRAAAGEAIALLYHSCGFGADEEEGWEEEEEAEEGDGMSLASSGTHMSGLDVVVERMQQLASNRGDGVRRWAGAAPAAAAAAAAPAPLLLPCRAPAAPLPRPCRAPAAPSAPRCAVGRSRRRRPAPAPAHLASTHTPCPPPRRAGRARGAPRSSPPSAGCAPRWRTAACRSSACGCSTATRWRSPRWRPTCSSTACAASWRAASRRTCSTTRCCTASSTSRRCRSGGRSWARCRSARRAARTARPARGAAGTGAGSARPRRRRAAAPGAEGRRNWRGGVGWGGRGGGAAAAAQHRREQERRSPGHPGCGVLSVVLPAPLCARRCGAVRTLPCSWIGCVPCMCIRVAAFWAQLVVHYMLRPRR